MRITDLFSADALHAEIDAKRVRVNDHPTEPLRLFNYTELAQFQKAWNPVTRACRGLIINRETGEIIARPFPKFFNHGESASLPFSPDEPVTVTDMPAREEWQPWEPTPGLEAVYLVDIDGTVAIKGDRDIYDGSKAYLDTPNRPVVSIIRMLQKNHRIIYMTGRDAEHCKVTADWLKANALIADELHTRPLGDKRKDSTVKHELFNTHIRGRYNVAGVFDDRNQVVEMWRAIGLTVFQVADGNF